MAINLHEKYAKEIAAKYSRESVVKGLLCEDYDFSGARTVRIATPITVPMSDYTRGGVNRYGTPTEMQDTVQELTLTQDKSFALTIDKGNNADQSGIKAAGRMLSLQLAEQAIPMFDRYVLNKLAAKAGKINKSATALDKSNVMAAIDAAVQYLDDAEVPDSNRALLVSTGVYQAIKQSGIDISVNGLSEKVFSKGFVGEYGGMKIVKVPAGRLPAGTDFMIVYKNAAAAPVKLNDTKIHQDPPGISGNLLEGRQYYDCFVFGAKAAGIYLQLNASAEVCADPVINAANGSISCGNAEAAIFYTTDGTDPRYSNTAKTYTAAISESGVTLRAYAVADGYPSGVVEAVLA